MGFKKQIAENIIAEVELNGFEDTIDDWEVTKKLLLGTTSSALVEEHFWDCVKFIAESIGNKVRR